MRVIVSLYRFIVGGFFLLCVIGIMFLIGLSFTGFGDDAETNALFGGMGLVFGLAGIAFTVLAVGVTAVFISMHDRLCELVQAVERIADRPDQPHDPS